MTAQARSRGKPTARLLPIATAVFAAGIFIADSITHLEIAVAVLYVAVVLMASQFCPPRGVVLVGAGCVGLTVLSYLIITPTGPLPAALTNLLISIATIGVTTFLALQRQAAEATLREQANLLELTHDAIFVRDPDNVVKYWNRGAEELYGWPKQEAVGRASQDLLRTEHPMPAERFAEMIERQGAWTGELTHTTRDGRKIAVESRHVLLREPDGRRFVLETNRDVSDRKRADDAIRKLNQELEQKVIERTLGLEAVNKELEAFAYSVSHDLRAPLRHMVGYAELLQKNAAAVLDEKCRRYTSMIVESTKRMGTLIDDLLAFSRVGRVELQKAPVPLEQVLREALSEVRQETDGRTIDWKIAALPGVRGDRSMLRLAMVNLISNAVKFSHTRPRPEIEIGCTHGKDETVVFIRDNGVGFDMKYVHKLFGVFQRLHRVEEFEGTGIGLATVQRVIHRHGGRVWAEGAVDGGATFYFSVPKS
jgi:PAS domain S-box-containing protein